jgi:hypothetical protein
LLTVQKCVNYTIAHVGLSPSSPVSFEDPSLDFPYNKMIGIGQNFLSYMKLCHSSYCSDLGTSWTKGEAAMSDAMFPACCIQIDGVIFSVRPFALPVFAYSCHTKRLKESSEFHLFSEQREEVSQNGGKLFTVGPFCFARICLVSSNKALLFKWPKYVFALSALPMFSHALCWPCLPSFRKQIA